MKWLWPPGKNKSDKISKPVAAETEQPPKQWRFSEHGQRLLDNLITQGEMNDRTFLEFRKLNTFDQGKILVGLSQHNTELYAEISTFIARQWKKF